MHILFNMCYSLGMIPDVVFKFFLDLLFPPKLSCYGLMLQRLFSQIFCWKESKEFLKPSLLIGCINFNLSRLKLLRGVYCLNIFLLILLVAFVTTWGLFSMGCDFQSFPFSAFISINSVLNLFPSLHSLVIVRLCSVSLFIYQ